MSSSASQSNQTNSSTESEITPLIAPPASAAENNGNYYFLNSSNRRESFQSATSRAGTADGGELEQVVEKLPYGATEEEFASRPVGVTRTNATSGRTKQGIFTKLFGRPTAPQPVFEPNNMTIGSLMKKRQAAIKIEPKVFFANERTFLAWMHSSVLLAGASVAIVSMSDDNLLNQLYGVILLPIAIAFMIYSMHMYGKRAMMIRRRAPGPYEDVIGPAVLAVALMLSIVTQFTIKVYYLLSM